MSKKKKMAETDNNEQQRTGTLRRWLKPSILIPGGLLIVAFAVFAHFYLKIRHGFFDDTFIYLHIAKNGAESGTWQYFPIVDRPALLASSPLKIVLLTIAAYFAQILGFGARTFYHAKLILVLYAPLPLFLFLPFWPKRKLGTFLFVGAIYFFLACCLNTIVDFEGGLFMFWMISLLLLLQELRSKSSGDVPASQYLPGAMEKSAKLRFSWILPLGGMIRPDLALPVYLALLVLLPFEAWKELFPTIIKAGLTIGIGWCLLCFVMDVWPIPVTYWTKASMPKLVEQASMLEVLPLCVWGELPLLQQRIKQPLSWGVSFCYFHFSSTQTGGADNALRLVSPS